MPFRALHFLLTWCLPKEIFDNLSKNPPYRRTDVASIESLEGTLDKIDARELSSTYGINLYANLLYNVKALENDEEKYNSLVEGFSTKFKLSRNAQVSLWLRSG